MSFQAKIQKKFTWKTFQSLKLGLTEFGMKQPGEIAEREKIAQS